MQFIFIIGDDTTANLLLAFVLKKYFDKPDIRYFPDATIALTTMRRESEHAQPTIVLLDRRTGGISCWEFLDHFGNLEPEIQSPYSVYAMSSDPDLVHQMAAKRHAAVPILPKPITIAALQRTELGRTGQNSQFFSAAG